MTVPSLRDIVDIDVDVTAIPEADFRALVEQLATFMESLDQRTMAVTRRIARERAPQFHPAAVREQLASDHAQAERDRDLDRCVALTLVKRAVATSWSTVFKNFAPETVVLVTRYVIRVTAGGSDQRVGAPAVDWTYPKP